MIHSHSSGKHSLLKKMLAVCIAFAMICSVSISAFSVEASSENTDETVQSVMTEEAGDPEVAEAETDSEQTPGEEQTEEPEVPQQHILGKQQFIILPILQEIHGQMIQEHGHRHRKQVIQ